MTVLEFIIALIGSNGLSTGLTFFFTKRRYLAEVSKSELDNVEQSLKIYKDMIDDLGLRINVLSSTINHLREENETLISENKAMRRKMAQMDKEINYLKNVSNNKE